MKSEYYHRRSNIATLIHLNIHYYWEYAPLKSIFTFKKTQSTPHYKFRRKAGTPILHREDVMPMSSIKPC